MTEKQSLRQEILARREAMSAGEVSHRSQRVFREFVAGAKLLLPPAFERAALYYPVRGEVDTRPFFDYLATRSKTCLFPRVEGAELAFYPVRDWAELMTGAYGIAEPLPGPGVRPAIPDVLFVPGVAFSRDCFRLGFGAGYYDRYLERGSVRTIGLAHDFQLASILPLEAHDRPLDFVVTESAVISREAA